MSDLNVTLRITADGKVAVEQVQRVKTELDGIGSSAETAGARTEAGMGRARRGVESISQQLKQARDVLLSFVGIQFGVGLVRDAGRIADEMSRMRGQIALVTNSTAELAAVQNRLFEVSQRTSTGLASTVQLYTRLARATAELGIEQDRLAALTETINQTFVVSATPASAAANAITQLTQAFAGGVLRAEEFNSVIENSPRLAQALADGLGVGIGALRRMVNEGQITSEAIIRALESQAETIRREFESMPLTIEQAWTRVANAAARYIGDADQARGASRRFAEALASVADHLDAIIDAALTLGSVLLAAYGARAIAAAVAYSVELGRQIVLARAAASAYAEMGAAAAAAGATGLRSLLTLKGALNGLVALFAGWQIGTYLREQFVEVEVAGIRLVTQLMQAWEYLKQSGAIAWEAIKAAAIGAVNLIRTRIADLLASIAGLAGMGVMGVRLLGNTAAAVRQLEAAIRPTTSAYEGFLAAKRRIVAESGVEIGKIREIEEAMIADAYARRAAAAVTATQTEVVDRSTGAFEANAGGAEAAAAALREAARAADEGARAYERFWSAQDQLQAMLDEVAAQLGGPSVRAAQQLRDALVRLAQIEMDLLAIGPLTVEQQRQIQLAREGLLATYQQTADGIAESEERLAGRSRGAVDDWQRTWLSGIDAVASAFGDWISGGMRSFRDFGRELLRIAQRVVADLIATFARARILQALGMGGGLGAPGLAMAAVPGGMPGMASLAGGITQGGGLLGGLLNSTFGAVGGALAGLGGALGGFGAGLTVAGNAGLIAAGQFGMASLAAGNLAVGLGAMLPVIGTIAAVAAGINALTGGRLFGTSWKPTGVEGVEVGIGPGGASGSGFREESRRRSLFRGTARRTVSTPLDDRAMADLDRAFDQIEAAVTAAAQALRVDVPPIIEGAWKEIRDRSGAVISQTSTVLGRQFQESFEDFQRRITAESILAVIDRALGNTVAAAAGAVAEDLGGAIGEALKPIGPEIGGIIKTMADAGVSVSAIAERWRGNATELLEGAQFLLAAVSDIQRGAGLLGGASSLPALADLIEDLAKPSESLAEAYARAAAATRLLDQALRLSGVTIDSTREAVVRFAVEIAEAAGGLDQAAALWQRFFEVAYTEEERLRAALAQAEQARDSILGGLGLDADTSLADLRAAIEGLLAAGGDPERIVGLLRAADAVGRVNELLDQLADLAGESAGAIEAEADELARLAEIARIMDEVQSALDRFDLSPFAIEIQRIQRTEAQRIAQLTALGASESQLAAVRRLATLEQQAAISGLRASIASLRDQLYGTPLSRIEEQIRQFQSGQIGAIQAVGDAAQAMWDGQFQHVQRITDYLQSLLTGPNSLLTPRQRLDAAMQDYRETLRRAQGGDADALARITQVADVAFREMRAYFGSSGPTQDFFREMQQALRALQGVAAIGGGGDGDGGVAVGGGGAATVPPELAALLAERDRLIAEQQARERLSLATTLAQQLGELADALQRPFAELANELGINLEALARDLGIDPDGIADLIERLTTTRVAEHQLAVLEGLGDTQLAALGELVTQSGLLGACAAEAQAA